MAIAKRQTVEFNRPFKYRMVRELGSGACGETVLLHDENMDCHFVAKKYSPIVLESDDPDFFAELHGRFRQEAKILFQLNHQNIVRVFNYFDYGEFKTSYIVMEFVDGTDILGFISSKPFLADKLFERVIDGFLHLEQRQILHRDIRPENILVSDDGNPKIIDFGFGKTMLAGDAKHDKSISLNWWCAVPDDFQADTYDIQTEIYFVGKLFEAAIVDGQLTDFKYTRLVRSMCAPRQTRIMSFQDIQNGIASSQIGEIEFTWTEKNAYREFTNQICNIVASTGAHCKFERDPTTIIDRLDLIFNSSMLEENVPNPKRIVSVFVKGPFQFWPAKTFSVEALENFLWFYKSLSSEKRAIVTENVVTRLESLKKTVEKKDDDDIPF